MFTTILLSLSLIILTLLSTSFHLTNLGLLFLLIIFIFRRKHLFYLMVFEALILFFFTPIRLGLSLLLIATFVGLLKVGEENIFPGRKFSSFLIALVLVVLWELVNATLTL
jgi:hypothetical protein